MTNSRRELIASFRTSAESDERMNRHLIAILTPKELQALETRLQIVKMLKQGVDHRTIADHLGVGVSTVTRGSRELSKGNFVYV